MSTHTRSQHESMPVPATSNGQAAPSAASVTDTGVASPARAAAARRRSRRGLLIAVIVVALGGVLGFTGANMLTRHVQVLAVARDVPVGQVITDADLVVAAVNDDPNLSPIPADQRDQVVGLVAQVPLVRGELLTRAQIGPANGFTEGQQMVALPLKPGQLPSRGLAPGQHVLVVATTGSNAVAAGAQAPAGGAPVDAIVADVGPTDPATSLTVVDVRVAAAAGPGLADLASTGNLAVILLPAGG